MASATINRKKNKFIISIAICKCRQILQSDSRYNHKPQASDGSIAAAQFHTTRNLFRLCSREIHLAAVYCRNLFAFRRANNHNYSNLIIVNGGYCANVSDFVEFRFLRGSVYAELCRFLGYMHDFACFAKSRSES